MKKLIIALGLLLASCGVVTPDCSDKVVTDTVLELSNIDIGAMFLNTNIGNPKPTIRSWRDSSGVPHFANDAENARFNREKEANATKAWKAFVPKLSAIRTNRTDYDARKCRCAGNVEIPNGEPMRIEYTAQYTDENEIYVEILRYR